MKRNSIIKTLRNFFKKNTKAKKMLIYRLLSYIPNKFCYNKFGQNSLIYFPMLINNKNCISIGKYVTFREHLRMDAIKKMHSQNFNPQIIIDDYVHAEQDCQIFATNLVHIKKNVTLSSHVFITDAEHEYKGTISGSILNQKLNTGETVIEEEAFLGIGVRVIKAVHIGKHAVIGANSVVTNDIPAYSVAVGIPARVIKQYNPETNQWERNEPYKEDYI